MHDTTPLPTPVTTLTNLILFMVSGFGLRMVFQQCYAWSLAIDQSWYLYHLGLSLLQLTENPTQGKMLAHILKTHGFGFKHTQVRTSLSLSVLPSSMSASFSSLYGAPGYSRPLLSWPQIPQKIASASPKALTKILGWTQLALLDVIWVTCLSLN